MPPPDFKENVVNLVAGRQPLRNALGDAPTASLYNQPQDTTYAFISTPRVWGEKGSTSTPMYAQQVSDLQALLREIIPRIAIIVRPYEKPWVRDTDKVTGAPINLYPQDQLWRGQALFEYDPLADGRFGADWRLWYEEASERGRKGLGQLVD
ncbi:uncharacterized protein K460DRAFT_409117 [Cucurbitaria berberidis CBS 394.84]|uniref:Uncharacterized protein n=1 Tax=Cucurbitaria berberidis CBS 394.84 TaxID=1168544 RepID=A0A9P4GAG8_9PLEO|nr:uncharacterized protein K460DRAFT_409117 [Cucurbitaria berberidis CBS 394.84]KAF1841660.1 hypothetical protein K460DRAFT_409117 [Cucurbitaria berberidis CBS 394.84]